ncbi:MAG TPA: right-handed parallel beta-helix repeat-containing protein [Ignavibacteria bacterium]
MKRIIFLIFLPLFLYGQIKSGYEIFVSPGGNDNNNGSEKKPFKTIERAKEYIKSLKSQNGDIIVYLRGGEYYLNKTVVFKSEDSGKNGFFVIYKAYKDEKPVISGGVEVKGWEKYKDGIYRAKFNGEVFRQLYVNGKKAIRARDPEKGTYYRLKFWDYKYSDVIVDANQVAKIKNIDKVEMIPHLHWAEQVLHLASIDKIKEFAYIKFKEPAQEMIFKRDYPIKAENESYHFENALEFLDTEGEWFFDENEKYIYYKPYLYEDISKSKVIVPQLETLIKIEGTIENPVKNLVFYGITFAHSNWNLPSKTSVCFAQAGQYTHKLIAPNEQYFKKPESAIQVDYAQNIKFERNIFKFLGSTGLDFFKGVSNSSIIGNIFYQISGNGISLGTFSGPDEHQSVMYNPKDEREGCSNDTISNNVVTEVCHDYINACGITVGYARGMVIKHNEVYNLPYTGISVGWGWEDKPNFMKNNTIQWNHIYDVMKILCDGGGIYTLSRQPESDISYNFIHDISKSIWAIGAPNNGIFFDQGSSGFTIYKNVFKDIPAGNTRHNMTGKLNYIENEYYDEEVMTKAGLEEKYKDIKKFFEK